MIIENNNPRYKELKGHVLGQILTNLNDNVACVPIPKNASTFLRQYFEKVLAWTGEYNYNQHKKEKYIVALRDPLERWISGTIEYYNRQNYKKTNFLSFLNFAVNQIVLDEHTVPQTIFLQGLDTDNMHFFKVDNLLDIKLSFYLNKVVDSRILFKNDMSSYPEKLELNYMLREYLQKNKDVVYTISKFYKSDYDLFNQVKYYNFN